MSMNPGATTFPVASISRSASGTVADEDDRPSLDADVCRPRRGPGAVDDETVADRELDHRGALRSRVASGSTRPSAITTP